MCLMDVFVKDCTCGSCAAVVSAAPTFLRYQLWRTSPSSHVNVVSALQVHGFLPRSVTYASRSTKIQCQCV